eukprot:4656508-Prymnesium_polylepis.2
MQQRLGEPCARRECVAATQLIRCGRRTRLRSSRRFMSSGRPRMQIVEIIVARWMPRKRVHTATRQNHATATQNGDTWFLAWPMADGGARGRCHTDYSASHTHTHTDGTRTHMSHRNVVARLAFKAGRPRAAARRARGFFFAEIYLITNNTGRRSAPPPGHSAHASQVVVCGRVSVCSSVYSSTWLSLSRRSSRSNAQSPHGNVHVVASREEDRDGLE